MAVNRVNPLDVSTPSYSLKIRAIPQLIEAVNSVDPTTKATALQTPMLAQIPQNMQASGADSIMHPSIFFIVFSLLLL